MIDVIPNAEFPPVNSVITITTDFGICDSYVAQMKGVILSINPQAQVVDVTHAIGPQDVAKAARVIEDVVPVYPAGTIHIVVVDPGVGSRRRLLAAQAEGQKFVVPDNGLLAPLLHRGRPGPVHEISNPTYWRTPVSATFHGRDILAPVAAHWSLGVDPAEFGSAAAPSSLVPLDVARPHREGNLVIGRVEFADSFGNLITNITEADLPSRQVTISIGGRVVGGMHRYYSEVPAGSVLSLIGSSGRLEISINGGSASRELNIAAGAEVRIESCGG